MAQDKNGKPIHPGDLVSITCLVTGLDKHQDYINLALQTVEGRMPDGKKSDFFINSHMVEVIAALGHSDPDLDVSKALSDPEHDFSSHLPEVKG